MRSYEKKLTKEAKNNPQAYYKYVNSKTKSKAGIPTLASPDGHPADCNSDKADTLNKYFSSVFTLHQINNR